jgi:hypothetical protein
MFQEEIFYLNSNPKQKMLLLSSAILNFGDGILVILANARALKKALSI